MRRQAITGFHQDQESHWVAELACGHTQHVRHDPPWQLRPWAVTEDGRAAMLGRTLVCKLCDATQTGPQSAASSEPGA